MEGGEGGLSVTGKSSKLTELKPCVTCSKIMDSDLSFSCFVSVGSDQAALSMLIALWIQSRNRKHSTFSDSETSLIVCCVFERDEVSRLRTRPSLSCQVCSKDMLPRSERFCVTPNHRGCIDPSSGGQPPQSVELNTCDHNTRLHFSCSCSC